MRDKIITWFEDEESRFIFQKRVEFNDCHDYGVFREIIDHYVPELVGHYYYPGKEKVLLEKLKRISNIWIGGGGIRGRRIVEMLHNADIVVTGVLDRDDQIKDVMGVPVFHWDKVDYNEIDWLLISLYNKMAAEECVAKAIQLGVDTKKIIMFRDYSCIALDEKQYFEEFIQYSEGEVFVDAGVLDLSTSLHFAEECRKNHISDFRIYAFEPDKKSFERCEKIKSQHPELEIELMQYGLWSSNTMIGFDHLWNGSSKINEGSGESIKCVTLDSVVNEKVSFIKMDIEGAELEALKGCQDTIRKYHPKLAISIYHKPEDIIEIPCYIKELVPRYRLYLRHYGNGDTETVLYALP